MNPGNFGARYARLTTYLDSSHYGVKLTDNELRRITLWLDLNSNELGAYTRVTEQREGKIIWPELDVDTLNPLGVEDPTSTDPIANVRISPFSATIKPGSVFQFTATAVDLLNRKIVPQPEFSWNVSGGGSINPQNGLFSAGNVEGGPYTVTAKTTVNGIEQTCSAIVVISTLNGVPLPAGNMKQMLCLAKNTASTCLTDDIVASITNKYIGTNTSSPVDGASFQVNGSTYTWADQTNNTGIWFSNCGPNTTSYSFITITNTRERTVKLGYLQDDEITVWMNGTELFSDKSWNTKEELSSTFTLPRGNVPFLIKWGNIGGQGTLSLRFTDGSGADVNDLLYYTDPGQTRKEQNAALLPIHSKPYSIRSVGGHLRIDGVGEKAHRVEIFSVRGQRLAVVSGVGSLRYRFPEKQFDDGFYLVRMVLDERTFIGTVTLTGR